MEPADRIVGCHHSSGAATTVISALHDDDDDDHVLEPEGGLSSKEDRHGQNEDAINDATSYKVMFKSRSVQTPGVRAVARFTILYYFFLLGLELLNSSAKIVGACKGHDFTNNTSAIIALFTFAILAVVFFLFRASASHTTATVRGCDTVVNSRSQQTIGRLIFGGVVALCLFLCLCLLGLELLNSSEKIIEAYDSASQLLANASNPVAALMIGIFANVMLQSPATTVSIILSLVGSETITTRQAIYMIMGGNIGTSVVNTLVSLRHLSDRTKLERAFAVANLHDIFNALTVIVVLPIEAATGYLYNITKTISTTVSHTLSLGNNENWAGPIERFVAPLAAKIIIAKEDAAHGGDTYHCDSLYPVHCQDPSNPTKTTCSVGLIDCDLKTNNCPIFFVSSATQRDDELAGALCFLLSLVLILVCSGGLVTVLQESLLKSSSRVAHAVQKTSPYCAMTTGAVITVLIRFPFILTAMLTHVAGMELITIEEMLPMTLGSNLGTAVTVMFSSLSNGRVEAFQIALAYLCFNLSGILILYPSSCLRRIALDMALRLGRATRVWRGFPAVYVIAVFFITPLGVIGLAESASEQWHGGSRSKVSFVLGLVAVWSCLFVCLRAWLRPGGKSTDGWQQARHRLPQGSDDQVGGMEGVGVLVTFDQAR